MIYRFLAGSVALIHFVYIGFMILGFLYVVRKYSDRQFLQRWMFRTIHFMGIFFVAFFAVFRIKCPLTFLENFFLYRYNPDSVYNGPFTLHYLERFLFQDPSPWLILIPTLIIGVVTTIHFINYPPPKLKLWFRTILR